MSNNAAYAEGLGRAVIGAALFALPLFMTMEMWQFGFGIDRARLIALLLAALPLLVGLSYFAGFERAFGLTDHLLDVFAALAIAAITGGLILLLFGVVAPHQPLSEIAGKIALVTAPAAMGALLVDKQLNDDRDDGDIAPRSYLARLFIMLTGALFIAFNVAPTEEMILIAFQISAWQAIALVIASLLVLHALLFWVDLPGREARRGGGGFVSILIRYSFAGYALCALASLALLWVFGRTDGVALEEIAEFVAVLSFPAVWGAGLANLVVGARHG